MKSDSSEGKIPQRGTITKDFWKLLAPLSKQGERVERRIIEIEHQYQRDHKDETLNQIDDLAGHYARLSQEERSIIMARSNNRARKRREARQSSTTQAGKAVPSQTPSKPGPADVNPHDVGPVPPRQTGGHTGKGWHGPNASLAPRHEQTIYGPNDLLRPRGADALRDPYSVGGGGTTYGPRGRRVGHGPHPRAGGPGGSGGVH